MLLAAGVCSRKPDPVFSPLDFAKNSLAESYAAKADLGEVLEVTHKKDAGLGHAFEVIAIVRGMCSPNKAKQDNLYKLELIPEVHVAIPTTPEMLQRSHTTPR